MHRYRQEKDLSKHWYGLLRERAANRRVDRAYWIWVAILVIGLNLYAPASPTALERGLASLILLVALGMICRWTYRGRDEAELGFLPIMLIVYLLEFSLSIFTQTAYQMNYAFQFLLLNEKAIEKALLLSLLGITFIVWGYYWPGRRIVGRILPRFRMNWNNSTAVQLVALIVLALSTVAFLIVMQTNISKSVQAYFMVPQELFFPAMIALLILQLESRLHFLPMLLLWGVFIPARTFLGVVQGEFGLGILVIMAIIVTFATMRRRVPWTMFVVGFAAFTILQPVKGVLRQTVFVKEGLNKDQAQLDKAAAFVDSAERGMVFLEAFGFRDVLAVATARLNDIGVFATVVERTPQDVPFWYGASFYRLLFVPIPRTLYREKPDYVEGNVLGHQYQMIGEDDYVTSINLPQITELYGNFGALGLIVGCFFLGMTYRTINDCFVHSGCGLGALVAAIYLLTHLIDIENSFASVFGGLLAESLVVMGFHYSIRTAESLIEALNLRRTLFYARVQNVHQTQ